MTEEMKRGRAVLDNYEPRCNWPSPGGTLMCSSPFGHEHGHVWWHSSHKNEDENEHGKPPDARCEAPGPCNCAARADLPEELLPIYSKPPVDQRPYDSGRMWGGTFRLRQERV